MDYGCVKADFSIFILLILYFYFLSELFINENLLLQIFVSDSGSVFFIFFGKLEEGILF